MTLSSKSKSGTAAGRDYFISFCHHVGVPSGITDRQQENAAKFLHDMAKGIALIAVVGSLVGGQTSGWAIFGLVAMAACLHLITGWMAEEFRMFKTFTFFDQVMLLVAILSVIAAVWGYFYTHPRKKQK